MLLTAEERELKFRRFIKLKAQGMKRTRIMREIGKKLKNILTNYLFNLKIAEISDKTYAKWDRIDDDEEVFITKKRNAGRHRETTAEDDNELRTQALANNWSTLDELRQIPVIANNPRLSTVSDKTLQKRLKEGGNK